MLSPVQAKVFIVGYNPAKAYPAASVQHERHVDALFNRNGETCRGFYNEVTKESPTRSNIDMLAAKLARVGVESVLETNIVCYATPKKKDLNLPEHIGGKAHGLTIFHTILREIAPKSIIIHGKGVRDEFNRTFPDEPMLPPPPDRPGIFPQVELSTGTKAFVIPSLALPGYQNWPPGNSFCNWSDVYLDELAIEVAAVCRS
ncbi:hypothetical protein AB4Z32_26125 [Massilia sp. 2TAF26]|uniref:hypothetical protein n=1 Tax=Massilia sp. 2TAF26 TaxID=3233012 RepID=UPI003F96D0A8